jgi:nitrate reductase alpha subunit
VGHPLHLYRQPADADAVRGGPIVWISETDAKKAGIVDNDWIEAFNANGALDGAGGGLQRIKEGMTFMYHAQEKIVNTPGSEITGQRGGIHNSVTRACSSRRT